MDSTVSLSTNSNHASAFRIPERLKSDYERYLERRVFEVLKDVRPWGINGETLKWLLMNRLVREEDEKKFPLPSADDVDKIMKKYWNIEQVKKQQQRDEIRALEVSVKDEKPTKGYTTPANGILGTRIFADIGADVTVVREAARILESRKKDNKTSKLRQEYDKYMAGFDTLNMVKPVISVVKEKDECKAATEQLLAYETPVSPNRWEWLPDKDRLRKSDKVEQVAKILFTDDKEGQRRRTTTNASASSASSNASKPSNEAAMSIKVEPNGESTGALPKPQKGRKRKDPEAAAPSAAPKEAAVAATQNNRPTRRLKKPE
ncbi:uncharacterized protein LOC129588137 [Paramacrobiotus metropolitanus]|uniref:uncharacterized protein LOC129588137 n=1 Tax=Paramacrobiotus metropolitanus TaxID=2943436 RepID=UPI00244618C3|nr:uncharacterized protein LOC129588137 [Paramacrobiotus metropolitanus]XP_055338213.1 uncharacterized protein LOC129588137 [Paramacrobiotus metropolitanus]XP_055338215.1 uncharacterized protein LOC129588137 [Paramacrobiotus metropolitanus]XP_055338216.1 uncharacterized protein LOC129588137 [Paramacrobiotus metropolitanus]